MNKTKIYYSLVLGQTISQIGENMGKLSLSWFAYTITKNSGYALAVLGLLQALPPLLFGWFYGTLIDKADKKTIMICTDFTRSLLILIIPVLYYFNKINIEIFFADVFAISFFSGLFYPAITSVLPELSNNMLKTNSVINTTNTIGLLVGPSIGGIIATVLSPAYVIAITGITFLLSTIFMLPLKLGEHKLLIGVFSNIKNIVSVIKKMFNFNLIINTIKEDIRHTFLDNNTSILATVTFIYGVSLSPIVTIMPIFIKQILHGGPEMFGELMSITGVGMLVSNIFMYKLKSYNVRPTMAVAFLGAGITTFFWAFSTSVIDTYILAFLAGAFIAVVQPVVHTEIQEKRNQESHGRIFSMVGTLSLAGYILGSIITYILIGYGAKIVLLFAGITRIVGAIISLKLNSKVEKYNCCNIQE